MDEENKREKSTMELWAEDEVKIACHVKIRIVRKVSLITDVPAMKVL